MIALPPLDPGAVNVTVAVVELVAVAVPIVGALGIVIPEIREMYPDFCFSF